MTGIKIQGRVVTRLTCLLVDKFNPGFFGQERDWVAFALVMQCLFYFPAVVCAYPVAAGK